MPSRILRGESLKRAVVTPFEARRRAFTQCPTAEPARRRACATASTKGGVGSVGSCVLGRNGGHWVHKWGRRIASCGWRVCGPRTSRDDDRARSVRHAPQHPEDHVPQRLQPSVLGHPMQHLPGKRGPGCTMESKWGSEPRVPMSRWRVGARGAGAACARDSLRARSSATRRCIHAMESRDPNPSRTPCRTRRVRGQFCRRDPVSLLGAYWASSEGTGPRNAARRSPAAQGHTHEALPMTICTVQWHLVPRITSKAIPPAKA